MPLGADLLDLAAIAATTLARGDWRLRPDGADIRIVRHRGRPWRGGRDWRLVRARADQAWALAEQDGETIYGRPPEPPGLLRLHDWSVEQGRLSLTLGRTWYWAHVGSGKAAQQTRAAGDGGPGLAERAASISSKASFFADPLTINIAMLFPGGPVPQVLIMQRGSAFGSRRPRLSLVGGYAERSDLARGGAPAPWRAALREIREETALALPSDTLRFLGLCRGAGDGTPSLSGVIALDAAPTDHHLVPADPREVAGYEYWPFEPERLAHLLQQRGGWAALVPLSAAALVHALADHYGDDAVTPLRRVHG